MKFDPKFSFVECVDKDSAKYQIKIYIKTRDVPSLVGIVYVYNNTWKICNNPVFESVCLEDAIKESISTYLKYHGEFEKLKTG